MTRSRKSFAASALELALIVAAAVGLALLVQAFLVKPYRIPSGSMLPTLRVDQRILVDRIGTHFGAPQVGDIEVFHPPADFATCADPAQGESQLGVDSHQACDVAQRHPSTQTFVKRIVGLPGDRLSIRDGHVIRDGVPERDPYAEPCGEEPACNFPATITVPAGDYYMMGDNRPDSEDSRFWGPVPRAWLIGKAFLTYWPPNRVGLL